MAGTRFDPSKRTLQVVTFVDKTDDKYSRYSVVPEFPQVQITTHFLRRA